MYQSSHLFRLEDFNDSYEFGKVFLIPRIQNLDAMAVLRKEIVFEKNMFSNFLGGFSLFVTLFLITQQHHIR